MKRTPFAIVAFILGAGCAVVIGFYAPAILSIGSGAVGADGGSDPAVSTGIDDSSAAGADSGSVTEVSPDAGNSITAGADSGSATGRFGIGSSAAGVDSRKAPAWTEIKWPFLLDEWGVGKAWACPARDCGARIEVYVRPKIGFCNCTTGVADEAELERVADTDLVSETVKPAGPAAPVNVRWMKGLSRPYQVSAQKPDERLLSVAFNNECDVVVALAAIGKADPAAVTPAVVSFLNTTPVVAYAREVLGLDEETGHSGH